MEKHSDKILEYSNYGILGIGEGVNNIDRYKSVSDKISKGAKYSSLRKLISVESIKRNSYNEIWMENVVGSWTHHRDVSNQELINDFHALYNGLKSGGSVYIVEAYTPFVAKRIIGYKDKPGRINLENLGFSVEYPYYSEDSFFDEVDEHKLFSPLGAYVWKLTKK